MRSRSGFMVAVTMLAALAGCAGTPQQTVVPTAGTPIMRGAAAGRRQFMTFVASLNPDCTSAGKTTVSVVSRPEHGDVTLEQMTGFPSFPQGSKLWKCNERRVPGVAIIYQSDGMFMGSDTFVTSQLDPDGQRNVLSFDVAVQ
jgi:hypothetical protein